MTNIRGTVKHISLEGGFWGVIGEDNQKWLPINFPEQLKYEGARIEMRVEKLAHYEGVHMWGTAVRIHTFHTLGVEN